jgi:type I restriction-modification system DNA methylase subunit
MSLSEVLEDIYERIQRRPELEESEVTDVFTDNDFFGTLGYEGIPIDVRSENHIVGGDRPDYFAKDKYSNTIFVVEFKKPSRSEDLASHKNQLWEQYVVPLRAKYGILTDGQELIFYERDSRNRRRKRFRTRLDNASDEQLEELEQLEKPDYTFNKIDEIESYFETADSISVGELVDGEPVGQNEFLDTFRLEKNTLFYEMLEQTYELLEYYLEQDYSENASDSFPKDAYEFWKEYYAPSDPNWYSLPKEWRDIAGTASNKKKVMFAVETVQSILGRLMLAKACEDYDFPNVSISEHIETRTTDFRGSVQPISHIDAGRSLMQQMREELVESVFEQDIYYWWTQPAEYIEGMSSSEIENEDWASEIDEFGSSLVEFTISMARFDFSNIRGDPLGELYQQYFDPKTRRALGEFYTPPSLCEYIVDSTGYGESPQNRRLIDPACGSGTFLMAALDEYKANLDDDDLPGALQDLCNRGHIVGLDIHPFAVVLAQIRFMLEILEQYKMAIEQEPDLVLRRLPIFRTDSLIDESEAQEGVQQSLSANYGQNTVEFSMPLPVRSGGSFETMDFEFPQFNRVQTQTGGEISLREEYFSALSAVFDAVKDKASDEEYSIEADELLVYFYDYFERERDVEQITHTFTDTANRFLCTVRELREEYNDGRLLKLIEDVVLGATLKNDIGHDYVVGNPPWVDKQSRSRHTGDEEERRRKELYLSGWNESDPYLNFIEKGMDMLNQAGQLGFLVPNRFLTNEAAKEIRALLAKNRIREIIDFTDVQLFQSATNYSAILVAEKQVPNDDWESFIENGEFTNQYQIRAGRIRSWDNTDILGLAEQIRSRESTETADFFSVDSSRFQERVHIRTGRVETEEVSESFDGQQGQITLTRNLPIADVWPFSPPSEYEILDQIESEMNSRLGRKLPVIRNYEPEQADTLVGDDIRQGIIVSGKGVYIVEPTIGIAKEELQDLDRLTIRPGSIDDTYSVETDLLKISIDGEDANRWLPDWDGSLVFVPYVQGDDRAELIAPDVMADEYPATWDYFTDAEVLRELSNQSNERREVHTRLAFELNIIDEENESLTFSQFQELSTRLNENPEEVSDLDDSLWWYRFMRRQNIEVLPVPKLLTGNQKQRNSLSFDDAGIIAPDNVRVYSIIADDSIKYPLAGVLNSAVVEFFHKQHARIHKGKAYSYIEDYTSKWPVVLGDEDTQTQLTKHVEEILHLKNLEIKIPQFPDPYIADAREAGREFIPVTYTPSSTFSPDPNLQNELTTQGFVIQLDDGDITDSAIDSREKANYVIKALEMMRLESNETVTIPVPRRNEVAESALNELEAEQSELTSSSIPTIEDEIDDIVFELYGIDSERHREMIRRYNRQYDVVQAIDPEAEE